MNATILNVFDQRTILDYFAGGTTSLRRTGANPQIDEVAFYNGQVNVQSLLNTVSTLHAVRWLGANPQPHAFDKPQLVLTFTTSPDDKAAHKLTVGANTDRGTLVASARADSDHALRRLPCLI